MATLRTDQGTCTAAQRKTLIIAAKARGHSVDALRDAAGVRRLHELSAAAASALIEKYSGRGLPNPPGRAPARGRRRSAGVVARLITSDLVEQIDRLLLEYFGDPDRAAEWLRKMFKVKAAGELATAERAGQVIGVLKRMCERKDSAATARADAAF